MKSLINFVYNGEVNVYQNHLTELLRVANILKIKGLDEVISSETIDVNNRQNNTEISCANDENLLTPKIEDCEAESKDKDFNIPSTSDQTKTTKKRKSVTFSDTPEIVWDQLGSASQSDHGEYSGNGKRKLRSLSDICSITEIKKENDEDDGDDDEEKSTKNELIVTINPHSLYTPNDNSPEKDDNPLKNNPLHKKRARISRKMIRKNENFLRALEAVRDEGMGFCKAAKIHGVNNRTLWLEYQKLGYPMKNARKKSQS